MLYVSYVQNGLSNIDIMIQNTDYIYPSRKKVKNTQLTPDNSS